MLSAILYRLSGLRKLSILAMLFIFIAFIMNITLLIAGFKPGQMEYANMLTVNTSAIGQFTVGPNAGKKVSRGFAPITDRDVAAIANKGKEAVKDPKKAKDVAKNTANKATSAIAKDLGIKDWYSYHLTTVCQGTYEKGGKKKPSSCAKPKPFFGFNPADNIQQGLNSKKKNIKDLGWSEPMTDVIKGAKAAFNLVFLFYLGGVIGFAVSFLLALITIRSPGGQWVVKGKVYTAASTAGLLFLASVIQNFSINKLVDIINAGGNIINVHAYVGQVFITLTWTLTILALVVLLIFLWERRRWYQGI